LKEEDFDDHRIPMLDYRDQILAKAREKDLLAMSCIEEMRAALEKCVRENEELVKDIKRLINTCERTQKEKKQLMNENKELKLQVKELKKHHVKSQNLCLSKKFDSKSQDLKVAPENKHGIKYILESEMKEQRTSRNERLRPVADNEFELVFQKDVYERSSGECSLPRTSSESIERSVYSSKGQSMDGSHRSHPSKTSLSQHNSSHKSPSHNSLEKERSNSLLVEFNRMVHAKGA